MQGCRLNPDCPRDVCLQDACPLHRLWERNHRGRVVPVNDLARESTAIYRAAQEKHDGE